MIKINSFKYLPGLLVVGIMLVLMGACSDDPLSIDFENDQISTIKEETGGAEPQAGLPGTAGSISAWGDDTQGQVSDTPLGPGFVEVSAGWLSSFALHKDGHIVAWGSDDQGLVSDVPPGE